MSANADDMRLSEEQLFFYEDQICGEAENVYRFAMGMTFNPDTAYNLLEMTCQQAARSLQDLIKTSGVDLRAKLFMICYEKCKDAKEGNPGHTRLMSYLSQLDRGTRAVVIAKDMGGLTIEHIAAMINEDINKVRVRLANARKDMTGIFGS